VSIRRAGDLRSALDLDRTTWGDNRTDLNLDDIVAGRRTVEAEISGWEHYRGADTVVWPDG
jgi:hypothetical protein